MDNKTNFAVFGGLMVVSLILALGLYGMYGSGADKSGRASSEVPDISVNTGTTTEEAKIDVTNNEVKIVDKKMYNATMKTNMGDIELELYNDKAPLAVGNFVKLANSGFYNGTKFHRVIKDFMIQGGDPNSKLADWSTHGQGGPGYSFADEVTDVKLVAGVLAMANAGANTNGSQFFIVTAESTPWLDGKHTAFGRVVGGMDVVRKIENVKTDTARGDHPIDDVVVTGITIK